MLAYIMGKPWLNGPLLQVYMWICVFCDVLPLTSWQFRDCGDSSWHQSVFVPTGKVCLGPSLTESCG